MRVFFSILFFTIVLISMITGCGGGSSDPTTPPEEEVVLNHRNLGVWDAQIDFDELTISVDKDNIYTQQYPVVAWLDPPEFIVNDWNPETRIIDIDVTVTNRFPVNAYDVRLIVYNTRDGLLLQNEDQWTRIYAPDDVEPVNPFRVFAKDVENRALEGGAIATENFLIYLPEGVEHFCFTIIGSYPGNCKEPYSFENFYQQALYPQWRCMTYLQVDVFDWQSDVNEVFLSCKAITGLTLNSFQQVDQETWGINIINYMAAPVGTYQAVVMAKSKNSGSLLLYDFLDIEITPDIFPPYWVSTVGIQSAAAGDGKITIYYNKAKDDQSPNMVKYYCYADTDDYPWDSEPVERPRAEAFTFTELQNGVTYYLGVRAHDDAVPPNIDQNTVILARTPMP